MPSTREKSQRRFFEKVSQILSHSGLIRPVRGLSRNSIFFCRRHICLSIVGTDLFLSSEQFVFFHKNRRCSNVVRTALEQFLASEQIDKKMSQTLKKWIFSRRNAFEPALLRRQIEMRPIIFDHKKLDGTVCNRISKACSCLPVR
jgi:hypothetical protein